MSNIIQEELGFTVAYKIDKITSVKPSESGDYQGVAYSASVKIRSVNVVTIDDPDKGLIDKEVNIEFSIPCEDRTLRKLNNHIRLNYIKANKPFTIYGALATRQDSKSIYSVKSLISGEEIMSTTEESKTKN